MYLYVSKLIDERDELLDEPADDRDETRLMFLTKLIDAIGADGPDVLIPKDDFAQHVREDAEETINARWLPYIDWEAYERDARSDYTEIEVDGETFLYIA